MDSGVIQKRLHTVKLINTSFTILSYFNKTSNFFDITSFFDIYIQDALFRFKTDNGLLRLTSHKANLILLKHFNLN